MGEEPVKTTRKIFALVTVAMTTSCVVPAGSNRNNEAALAGAASDHQFCVSYCLAAEGDLVEMRNNPTTYHPPLSPICVCLFGSTAVDVD